MKNIWFALSLLVSIFTSIISLAQPVMETGGQKMPDEWIDKTTGHKIIKLTRREGSNMSFYFHNNPFVENRMIFYGTNAQNSNGNDSVKQEIYNVSAGNKQIYSVDLGTLKIEQLTSQKSPMNGEIVGPKNHLVYYQIKDSVFSTSIDTKQIKLMHKRTMDMEIAGHEWFSPDGKIIWYDLQQPRSVNFFVSGTDVTTGKEKKYSLTRDEWSIHFNISKDQTMFCGDGGNEGQVAKA